MAKDMPLYGAEEFEQYEEFRRKRQEGLVKGDDPFFVEYTGLVSRRDQMWFADSLGVAGFSSGMPFPVPMLRDVVRYVEMETGREVFTDVGRKIIPGRELAPEDIGRMLDHAKDKWGEEGIKINGGGRFKMQVYEVAFERGMQLKDEDYMAYSLHRNREIERVASLAMANEGGERKAERESDGERGFELE